MTAVADLSPAALEPLRVALIARANAEADRVRAAAEADGQRLIAKANDEVATLLSSARAEGEAEAAALLADEAARARQAARSIVLGAQRAAYDELRRRACAAVHALLEDPAMRGRLAAVLRSQLGEDAVIHAQPDGGLQAITSNGRSIDASIGALVSSAVTEMDLGRLWAAS